MWYSAYWGSIPLNLSKLSAKKLQQFENSLEFQNIFENFYNAALNIFEYSGLPDTMDERMIERSFLLSGRCLAAMDQGGLLSLAGAPASGWTLYGYPVKAFGWGFNGYNKEFSLFVPGADVSPAIRRNAGGETAKEPEAVMGYDNSGAYPYINYLIVECRRLANLKMAIDTLVETLKMPAFISCDDTALNSVREAWKQRSDNMPLIVGTGKMPLNSFNVWDMKASPETLTQFRDLYEWHENRLRELLGINSNSQNDKKERLLVDEINANDEMTHDSVDKRLVWRRRWIDQINELFGTAISVDLRNKPAEAEDDEGDEEGSEDVDE